MSRPLECNNCKKPTCVFYKEIAGNSVSQTEMCQDCPILEKKLQHQVSSNEHLQDLTCHCCHTQFSEVRSGGLLGCPDCYSAFEELVVQEMKALDLLPVAICEMLQSQPRAPLHRGKNPEKPQEVALSTKLQELNQALNKAVNKENFEEAAYLRDQIKGLMERGDGK